MTPFDLSETSLSKVRGRLGTMRANLHNLGLTMPGCDVAYLTALSCGAGVAEAWEAARRWALIQLDPDTTPLTHAQRMYVPGAAEIERQIRQSRADEIARVRGLPNPFIDQEIVA